MIDTTHDELATYRARLADLTAEREALTVQYADLVRVRDEGHAATEAMARAMIAAGSPPFVLDPVAAVRQVKADLDANERARSLLSRMIGLLELRAGHQAAAPLFARAMSHLPAISRLLSELELELQATAEDVRSFERVQNDLVGLEAQNPEEPAPYRAYDLLVLREWAEDIVGDGVNRSRLDRWRDDVRETKQER